MNPNLQSGSSANGGSAAQDLFALSDEQILEIEPAPEVAGGEWRVASAGGGHVSTTQGGNAVILSEAKDLSSTVSHEQGDSSRQERAMAQSSSVAAPPQNDSATQGVPSQGATSEPPRWLAERMADADPVGAAEAREFWNGVQQARQEAAAYREVFAKPEEARAAADRSRQLEQID